MQNYVGGGRILGKKRGSLFLARLSRPKRALRGWFPASDCRTFGEQVPATAKDGAKRQTICGERSRFGAKRPFCGHRAILPTVKSGAHFAKTPRFCCYQDGRAFCPAATAIRLLATRPLPDAAIRPVTESPRPRQMKPSTPSALIAAEYATTTPPISAQIPVLPADTGSELPASGSRDSGGRDGENRATRRALRRTARSVSAEFGWGASPRQFALPAGSFPSGSSAPARGRPDSVAVSGLRFYRGRLLPRRILLLFGFWENEGLSRRPFSAAYYSLVCAMVKFAGSDVASQSVHSRLLVSSLPLSLTVSYFLSPNILADNTCQRLWLVSNYGVYQQFTYVHHTIYPGSRPP